MYSLLLVIIYIAFISLGLPDSLIGAGWPVMHTALHVPIAAAGMITMLIAMGTIVSSILSDRLTHRFGAGLVTAVSVLTTAIALLGFSLSQQFYMLCLWAIPYGMGAGAVDAALNNYVALHYAARHMSWLHSFWGVGAAVSPYIMGFALSSGRGWTGGYRIVGLLQIGLAAVLLLTLPLWRRASQQLPAAEKEAPSAPLHLPQIWRIPGVPFVLAAFFAYSAVEQTTGIWASSYLVQVRQVPVDTAANFASFFYLGITGGRFLSGFVADRFGDRALIRGGTILALVGIGLVALPGVPTATALAGLIITGLGCAPIFPAIIHATPTNFGASRSQAVIGVQMAAAYLGTVFMPPLFGWLASRLGMGLFPFYLVVFAIVMLFVTERLNRVIDQVG
ncbi:MAG: MFS transporter [Schleiferilactobacillus harbinensis]|nr:MFS transporter [Schleiferilactobacillus harbinensis]MCI1912666.1 MFS transporter [Schleiferilactobacillus harbinensis]